MGKFVNWTTPKRIRTGPVAVIGSKSKPGQQHTVYARADGSLSCDCPSYQFRATCRHCREAAQGWLSTVSSLQVAAQQMREQAERVMQQIDPTQTNRTTLNKLWKRIADTEQQINSMVAVAKRQAT